MILFMVNLYCFDFLKRLCSLCSYTYPKNNIHQLRRQAFFDEGFLYWKILEGEGGGYSNYGSMQKKIFNFQCHLISVWSLQILPKCWTSLMNVPYVFLKSFATLLTWKTKLPFKCSRQRKESENYNGKKLFDRILS